MAVSKKRKKKTKKSVAKKLASMKAVKEIMNKYKLDILDKSLKYSDEEFIKLKYSIEEYYNEIFDSKVERLKKFILNVELESKEDFRLKIKEYIEKWVNEVAKLENTFCMAIYAYEENLVKGTLYELGMDLMIYDRKNEMNDVLYKFTTSYFDDSRNYYEIYREELVEYIRNIFIANSFKVEKLIKDCLVEKNLDYDDVNIKESFEEKNDIDINYLDKYKDLNNLAEKNGYVYIRSNGGHGIFFNKEKNKTVIIPQGRIIGKGLSIIIQKQLLDITNKEQNKERNEQRNNYINEIKELRNRLDEIKNRTNNLAKDRSLYKELDDIIEGNPEIFSSHMEYDKNLFEIKELAEIAEIGKYLDRDDFKGGIKHAEEFVKKYPQSTKVIGMLGSMYEDTGAIDKAIKAYKKHIDLDGKLYEAYDKLINLLYMINDEQEARKYEKIISIVFENKINHLEEIYELISSGEYENAVEKIEVAEKLGNIIGVDEYAEIGRQFFAADNYKLSLKYNNKALKIYPNNEQAKGLNTAIMHMKILGVIDDEFILN